MHFFRWPCLEFLSGLVFYVKISIFVLLFWRLLAIVFPQIFSVFLSEMLGENSLLVRSGFLRPFRGNFSGFKVSVFALRVLVPSSYSFARFFRLFSGKCWGNIFLLSGLVFCDFFSGNFLRANLCLKVSTSVLLVLVPSSRSFCTDFFGFSPGNSGKIFPCCQATFFRKFSGANFCLKVSISVLRVLVPSSHGFWIFSVFLPEMLGKIFFFVRSGFTFFEKIFGSELLSSSRFQLCVFWLVPTTVSARILVLLPETFLLVGGLVFCNCFGYIFYLSVLSVVSSVFCSRLFVLGRVCRKGLGCLRKSQKTWLCPLIFEKESSRPSHAVILRDLIAKGLAGIPK